MVINCRPICIKVRKEKEREREKRETYVFGDGGGTVETQQEGSLELRLGTLDFGDSGTCRHAGPFFEGKVGKVVDVHDVFGNEIDTPETGVRVGSRKGHVRVGKVVAGDDMGQPAAQQGARAQGPIPVTKDTLHDEHGPVVGRLPSDTLDGDGEVDGVHRVVSDPDFGTDKLGRGVGLATEGDGVGGHGEGGKVLFGELDERIVLDGAGTDQGHPVGSVVFGNVGLEIRLGDRVDVFLGAEDGVSKRRACKQC